MSHPPVLTPERIDAMLSIVAEVCLGSVVEAGQRQKAAADDEGFERCGRTLQMACRNLRQTIAMKQRHDREQDRRAAEAREAAGAAADAAETARKDAERRRSTRVEVRRAAVLGHFETLLWDEYEDDDAQALFDDLDERVGDLSHDPDFTETPLDALIQRLADDLGLNDEAEDVPPQAPPPQAPRSHRGGRRDHTEDAERSSLREPSASSAPSSAITAITAVESDGSAVPTAAGLPPPDPPPRPPPRPPDPELYIPPWERLKPGQSMRGGGW